MIKACEKNLNWKSGSYYHANRLLKGKKIILVPKTSIFSLTSTRNMTLEFAKSLKKTCFQIFAIETPEKFNQYISFVSLAMCTPWFCKTWPHQQQQGHTHPAQARLRSLKAAAPLATPSPYTRLLNPKLSSEILPPLTSLPETPAPLLPLLCVCYRDCAQGGGISALPLPPILSYHCPEWDSFKVLRLMTHSWNTDGNCESDGKKRVSLQIYFMYLLYILIVFRLTFHNHRKSHVAKVWFARQISWLYLIIYFS